MEIPQNFIVDQLEVELLGWDVIVAVLWEDPEVDDASASWRRGLGSSLKGAMKEAKHCLFCLYLYNGKSFASVRTRSGWVRGRSVFGAGV